MASNLIPLIDGDILVYRCGFACKEDEPLEYCLATVKHAIEGILDRFPDRPEHHLYLTGKGNFRDYICSIQEYKGNRDPDAKPRFYSEIREYMEAFQGAEVIHGQEADDAIGIKQFSHIDRSTVICSIDKDLNMIPGWHYNFVKDDLYYVTLADANYNFFKQMLVGDRSDNVPGIHKVGDKTADKLLAPANKAIMTMKEIVLDQYRKQYGDNAESAYKEVANLLWIRRKENQECPY